MVLSTDHRIIDQRQSQCHHHHRLNVRFSMLARVGRFSLMSPLHFALSCAHSVFRPSEFMSPLTHSPHVFLDLPWHFAPTTSKFSPEDTQSLFSLRSKCPNHPNFPCLTTSVTASTFKRLFESLLDILLLRLAPHIYLTIIRYVLSRRCISSAFIGQVSLPYTKTLCTQALYTLPFTFMDAPLDVKTGANSLNLAHAHLTLALDAFLAPPPAQIMSPK